MISSKANKEIQDLIGEIEKNGIDVEKVVAQLKELRLQALLEKDPLMIRAIRLTYELLEEEEDFELNCLAGIDDEEEDEKEEEEEVAEEGTPAENLVYMLQLWVQSENKYNRDEIREFTDKMTELV